MSKTATLAGATGLIGNHLLEMLLEDDYYDHVRTLIRRPLNITHPKLEKKLVDFGDADSLLVAIDGSDVVFCTVGTTQQRVKGDKEAYRKVDYDIATNLARFCKMTGCEKFVLVSSAGANPKSRNFYLKLKGEVEESVRSSGVNSIHIMRPSMLLGDRKEFRFGELMGKLLMPVFSFMLPPPYKPIHAKTVARAMLEVSKKNEKGVFFHEYAQMRHPK